MMKMRHLAAAQQLPFARRMFGVRCMSSRIQNVKASQSEDGCLDVAVQTHDGVFHGQIWNVEASQCLVADEKLASSVLPSVIGLDPTDQAGIDEFVLQLDGTEDYGELTKPVAFAFSTALAAAGAAGMKKDIQGYLQSLSNNKNLRVPVPMFCEPGGLSILPFGDECVADADRTRKRLYEAHMKGDIEHLHQTIGQEGLNGLVALGIHGNQGHSWYDLLDLCNRYPIAVISSPYNLEDLNAWKLLEEKIGNGCQLCAYVAGVDDLNFVLENRIGNTIALDLIGMASVTAAINAIHTSRAEGYEITFAGSSRQVDPSFWSAFSVSQGVPAVEIDSNEMQAKRQVRALMNDENQVQSLQHNKR